jgi:hypothetical protein
MAAAARAAQGPVEAKRIVLKMADPLLLDLI